MHQRIAGAVAAAAVASLPLLAACGTGRSQTDGPGTGSRGAAPSSQVAVPTTDAPAPVTGSPTPGVDPAEQTRQVEAATEKFVRTVLTIGYPDKTFGDYTDRIEPLMTEQGFDSFESADSIKRGSAALTSLYAQKARSAPELSGDPEVTSIDATTATARLAYENVAQQRSGGGWKTVKSLGKGSVTVKLVLSDGKWLVDSSS